MFCMYMTGHSLTLHFLLICYRCPQRLINIFRALRHEFIKKNCHITCFYKSHVFNSLDILV